MRRPDQLVHSRARARQRYALFPLEGYPTSRLPMWERGEHFVLAAPALGAAFVQCLHKLGDDGGASIKPDGRRETFLYVLDGDARVELDSGRMEVLTAGGFALVPPTHGYDLTASRRGATLLSFQKVYEPASGIKPFEPIFGDQSDVAAAAFMDNPHARLQTLIPDELQYDLAINIFTFDPGHGLPYVETHVMEHGLLFLQGKGLYYLDGEWMEVEKDDFIWLGPYCPQSFCATGPGPAKYIYYKNVNRDIPL
jgi:(S)-ureidoglycine aminohydrolase